jgi:hypothetical protein
MHDNYLEKITQELLDWLSPVNPTAKQVEILKRRQPRTGTWFTEHEIFKQWLEGDVNRLWCPGIRMDLAF